MIVAAAPVADRAWIIDDWYVHLAEQTRPPDAVALLWTSIKPHGQPDDTLEAIHQASRDHGLPTQILHDTSFPHPRHDNRRFHTLARLRNLLLAWTRISLPFDHYLSIDTDVLLEDPDTISGLLEHTDAGQDVASPATWLHPAGDESFAYNAGWWAPDGRPGDPHRSWVRPPLQPSDLQRVHQIDIPMAVWLATRSVTDHCRYRWHESGEDLGLAQDLDRHDVCAAWIPALRARHVWDQAALLAA